MDDQTTTLHDIFVRHRLYKVTDAEVEETMRGKRMTWIYDLLSGAAPAGGELKTDIRHWCSDLRSRGLSEEDDVELWLTMLEDRPDVAWLEPFLDKLRHRNDIIRCRYYLAVLGSVASARYVSRICEKNVDLSGAFAHGMHQHAMSTAKAGPGYRWYPGVEIAILVNGCRRLAQTPGVHGSVHAVLDWHNSLKVARHRAREEGEKRFLTRLIGESRTRALMKKAVDANIVVIPDPVDAESGDTSNLGGGLNLRVVAGSGGKAAGRGRMGPKKQETISQQAPVSSASIRERSGDTRAKPMVLRHVIQIRSPSGSSSGCREVFALPNGRRNPTWTPPAKRRSDMAKASDKAPSNWLDVLPTDLVVGDMVTLHILVRTKGTDGKPVLRHDKYGRPYHPRLGYDFSGRVLDFRPAGTDEEIVIERTAHVSRTTDKMIPPVVSAFGSRHLDLGTIGLKRRIDHGPSVRTNDGGRDYLLDLLRTAAGGDHTNPLAVTKVARCVDPREKEAVGEDGPRQGETLYDIGEAYARLMLAGHAGFLESVYRQLRDLSLIPKAAPRPQEAPRTVQTDRQTASRARLLDAPLPPGVVECAPDPEVVEILRLFPGTTIVDVRRSGPVPEPDVQKGDQGIAGKADSPNAP